MRKPNVLVIMTDDQTAASVWAMRAVSTRLSALGTRFSHAFAATPICGPSRGSMLTGKWSHNTGVTNTGIAYRQMKDSGMQADTLATRLKDAGYRTGLFGKYNNDYDELRVPVGWDRWFAMLEPFNREQIYEFDSNGERWTFDRSRDNETDVISNNAEMFIRNAPAGPWFAYVCPHEPHGPYYPAPRHAQEFKGATWDPASEGEADLSDKPPRVRSEPTYTDVEEAQNERDYRGKLRELQTVDDMVANLLNALMDTGQLGETLIFFLPLAYALRAWVDVRFVPVPSDDGCGEQSGPVARITGYTSQRGRRVPLLPPYYRRPPSSVSPARRVRRVLQRWVRPRSGVVQSEVLRPLIKMRSGAHVALRQDSGTDRGVRVGGVKAPGPLREVRPA